MNFFVTGISKGLGLNIAKKLLQNNHYVYGISRTRSTELERLENSFQEKLIWRSFDLSANNPNSLTDFFREFIPSKIPLHGFVNNAAIAYDDIITNINPTSLEKMFWANTLNPMIITKLAIRNMIFNKIGGSIVHLSSISAHTGYKGLAMYASSKGALEAFSKNTAREWGEKGIRSNCIVAGFMETEMSSSLSAEMKNRIYLRTSLKQPTSIESVAETICFLLDGEKASSITGQNIFVDNGTI